MTMERTCKPVAAETINKLTFKDKMLAAFAYSIAACLRRVAHHDADAFIPYLLHSCEGYPVYHAGSFLVHLYVR